MCLGYACPEPVEGPSANPTYGPQKNEGPGEQSPRAFVAAMRNGSASDFLHHAAHTAHAVVMAAHAAGGFFLLFRQVGHGHLGGQHQPGDARGVL